MSGRFVARMAVPLSGRAETARSEAAKKKQKAQRGAVCYMFLRYHGRDYRALWRKIKPLFPSIDDIFHSAILVRRGA